MNIKDYIGFILLVLYILGCFALVGFIHGLLGI